MGDVVPRPPQSGSRLGVALVDDLRRAFVAGDRLDELQVGLDELGAAGGLDEQAWSLGIRRLGEGVDGRDAPRVEELDAGDAAARRDDARRAATGALDVREGDPQRDDVLGDRVQADASPP